MSKAAASTATSTAAGDASTVLLLQRDDIVSNFQHKDVIVGIARPCVAAAAAAAAGAEKKKETIGVKGRLDVLDAHSNVTLSQAQCPALGQTQPSRIAALRGANVQFIGIPK